MEKERGHMTERIINLTLEIIYLLTGENYIAFKLTDGFVTPKLREALQPVEDPPSQGLPPESDNDKKIQEVTSKMIELLTGEVPIRCQDVAVYISKEEKVSPEGHKDVTMASQPAPTSPDGSSNRNPPERCPRPLYSQDSTQEHQEIPQEDQDDCLNIVKVEDEEESYDDPCKEDDVPPEISTDSGDSRDTQRNVKDEEEEEEEMLLRIKEEESPIEISTDGSSKSTPERCPRPLYSRDSTPEDHRISQDDQDENLLKIEEKQEAVEPHSKQNRLQKKIPTEIGTDGRYRMYTEHPMVSSDDEDDGHVTSGSSEEDLVTPNLHEALSNEDPPNDTSTCVDRVLKHSRAITHHTATKGREPLRKTKPGKCFIKKRERTLPKSSRTEGASYSCPVCGKRFNRKGNLMSHQRTHSGEKPFSCSECGKCFAWKVQLVRHQTIHPLVNPLSCPDCGECFTERETLISHKKTHTMEKPYSCPECGKCFSWKDQLIRHLKIHTGEKPYSCSECGKCFPRISALNRHKKVHTGRRPYSCSECGMSFTERSYLVIHERTHTSEKPFSCSECGKRFNRTGNLFAHQRTHTGVKPYSCSECGECFTQKSTLIRHEKVHTGEKPYSCSECGKRFAQKGTLVLHERTHTGECPYACSQCGKRFSRRDYLISHLVFHDKKKIKN